MALDPRLMTVQSSQTSGTMATTKAAVTSPVARLFLILRAPDPGGEDNPDGALRGVSRATLMRTPCGG